MPFTLTHPKPEQEIESPKNEVEAKKQTAANTSTANVIKKEEPVVTNGNDQTVPVDLNLIEFDTKYNNKI